MQLIIALHRLHAQYPSLPLFMFLVALVIVIASFYNQKQQGRWIGYGAAAVMLFCFVFML